MCINRDELVFNNEWGTMGFLYMLGYQWNDGSDTNGALWLYLKNQLVKMLGQPGDLLFAEFRATGHEVEQLTLPNDGSPELRAGCNIPRTVGGRRGG